MEQNKNDFKCTGSGKKLAHMKHKKITTKSKVIQTFLSHLKVKECHLTKL